MRCTMNDVPAKGGWMSAYDREELYDQAYEDGRAAEREARGYFYETRLKLYGSLFAIGGFGAGVLLAPLFQ